MQNGYDKRTYGNLSLSNELKEKIESYFLSDISYTMPGAKDKMVVWDSFGKKRPREYYLTINL